MTCRGVAYDDGIKSCLFLSIRVEPTIEALTGRQPLGVSRIINYARYLTFYSPPNNDVSFNSFCGLALSVAQADAHPAKYAEPSAAQRGLPERDSGNAGVEKSYWEHCTNETSRLEFLEDLQARFQAIRILLIEAVGDRAVGIVLKERPGRGKLCSALPSQVCAEPCALGDLFVEELHDHVDLDSAYDCFIANREAGDQLVAEVFAALQETGIDVHSLDFELALSEDLELESIPHWDTLTLDNLQNLLFEPMFLSDGGPISGYARADDIEYKLRQQVPTMLNDLMSKFHKTLRYLLFRPDVEIPWPANPPEFDLPLLEELEVADCHINGKMLYQWMMRMPRLDHLDLSRASVPYRQGRDWTAILDAVRDHPTAKRTSTDNPGLYVSLFLQERTFYHVLYTTYARCDMPVRRAPDLPEHLDLLWGLDSHVSGAMAYEDNHVLRYWTRDWRPADASPSLPEEDYDLLYEDEGETSVGEE